MRELTLEETEKVAGGVGPVGAVIGGVAGGLSSYAAGGNVGNIIGATTFGAVGGFFGGIASATTGFGRAMFGSYAVGAGVGGSAAGSPDS